MANVNTNLKQRREKERLEQEAMEQKFQVEKSTRLLHAMAKAQSLGVEAHVYYMYDDVLYYEFNFSSINLPNSRDGFCIPEHCAPYEELSSWTMESIENQLQMVHDLILKYKKERLNALKKEVLARLTDEEFDSFKEALGL